MGGQCQFGQLRQINLTSKARFDFRDRRVLYLNRYMLIPVHCEGRLAVAQHFGNHLSRLTFCAQHQSGGRVP